MNVPTYLICLMIATAKSLCRLLGFIQLQFLSYQLLLTTLTYYITIIHIVVTITSHGIYSNSGFGCAASCHHNLPLASYCYIGYKQCRKTSAIVARLLYQYNFEHNLWVIESIKLNASIIGKIH